MTIQQALTEFQIEQQILGHTSLEMVKKYVHSTTRKLVPKFPDFSPLDNLARS